MGYSYLDNQYRFWQWMRNNGAGYDFHRFDLLRGFRNMNGEEDAPKAGSLPYEQFLGGALKWELDRFSPTPSTTGLDFPFNNILESIPLDQLLGKRTERSFESQKTGTEKEFLEGLFLTEDAKWAYKEAKEAYLPIEERKKNGFRKPDLALEGKWKEKVRQAAILLAQIKGAPSMQPFVDGITYHYGDQSLEIRLLEHRHLGEEILGRDSEIEHGFATVFQENRPVCTMAKGPMINGKNMSIRRMV